MPEAKYDQNVNEGLDTLKAYADKRGISSTPTPVGYQPAAWGAPGGRKPLSVRVWTCTACNARLDRDYNAAVNVMVAAGTVEQTRNACGGDVRHTLACADPETTLPGEETGTHRTDHPLSVPA